MPTYQAGEHKVDHPPLFACREHKQFLRFNAAFIEELSKFAADMVPGNLSEIAAPMVGGRADAFKLPDYLIPPRVLIWNPDGLKGPLALPFTLVFVDKRFIGIPAAYLGYERFEGCDECAANPPPPEPPRAVYPAQTAAAPAVATGSGVRKPPAPAPAPAGTRPAAGAPAAAPARPQTGRIATPSGSTPAVRPTSPPSPAKGTPVPPGKRPPAPSGAEVKPRPKPGP